MLPRAVSSERSPKVSVTSAQQSQIVRRVLQRVTAVTKNYSFNANGECQQAQQGDAESKKTESSLIEKFQYFRQQFMDASIAAGVTVPLDFLDDKSGRVFNFMHTQTGQCGPKYVLSVVESHPESIHLVRCSLSLLIVTIQVLRRKLPPDGVILTPFLGAGSPKLLAGNDSKGGVDNQLFSPTGVTGVNRGPPTKQSSMDLSNVNIAMKNNGLAAAKARETTLAWKQQVADGLSVWAAESLDKIANGSAMNICIKLLKCTQSEDIQDLALYLITLLVTVSQEASEYLMQAPGANDKKTTTGGGGGGGEKAGAPVELTCFSHLLSLSAFYKNRYHVISGTAEIVITLITSLMPTTPVTDLNNNGNAVYPIVPPVEVVNMCLSIAKTPAVTILPSVGGQSSSTHKIGGTDVPMQTNAALTNASSNNVLPVADPVMSPGKLRKKDGSGKKPFLRGMNPFLGKDVTSMDGSVKQPKPMKLISIKSTDNQNVYSLAPILNALGRSGSNNNSSSSGCDRRNGGDVTNSYNSGPDMFARSKSAKAGSSRGLNVTSTRPTTADPNMRMRALSPQQSSSNLHGIGLGRTGSSSNIATDAAGNPTIPWAGVKVFLKFLTRYSSYLQSQGQPQYERSSPSEVCGVEDGLKIGSALTHRQLDELTYAIARVVTALSLLIINCPAVEEYIRDHCTGALQIYFHSVSVLQKQFNAKLREKALRDTNTEEHAHKEALQEFEGYTKNQVILTHLARATLQQQYSSNSKHVLSNNTYIQQCVKLLRGARTPSASPAPSTSIPQSLSNTPAVSFRGDRESLNRKTAPNSVRPLSVSVDTGADTGTGSPTGISNGTYIVKELHRPDSPHNAYIQQAQGFQNSSVALAPVARGLSPIGGSAASAGPVLSNGKVGTIATGAAAAPAEVKIIEKAYTQNQLIKQQYSGLLDRRPRTSDGRSPTRVNSNANSSSRHPQYLRGADHDHFEGDELFQYSHVDRPSTAPGNSGPGAGASAVKKTHVPVKIRNSSSACYKGRMKEPPIGKNMLHRNFFATLPVTPFMPESLSAQEILHRIVDIDKFDAPSDYSRVYVTNSVEKSEFVSRSRDKTNEVLTDLQRMGYMRDGKQSVPLEEKAGRVYGFNSLTDALERNLEHQRSERLLRSQKIGSPASKHDKQLRRGGSGVPGRGFEERQQGYQGPARPKTSPAMLTNNLAPAVSNGSVDEDEDFRFTINNRGGISNTNSNGGPMANKYEQDIKFIENDSVYSVTNRHMLSTTKTQTYNHQDQEREDEVARVTAQSSEEVALLQARRNMHEVTLQGVLLEGTGAIDGDAMQADYMPIYTTRPATESATRNTAVEKELLLTLGAMNQKISDMTTAAPMDDYTHTVAEVENLKKNQIVEPLRVVQSMDLIFPASTS